MAGSRGPGEPAPGSRGTGGSPWRGVGGRGRTRREVEGLGGARGGE